MNLKKKDRLNCTIVAKNWFQRAWLKVGEKSVKSDHYDPREKQSDERLRKENERREREWVKRRIGENESSHVDFK